MIRAFLVASALCVGLVLGGPGSGALAHAGQPDPVLLAEISAAWDEQPVHLSERAGALTPEDAAQLNSRIVGWRDDVFITVLPASAFEDLPGASDPARAIGFLEALADVHGPDGVYIVAFGGVGTYGAAIGTDDPIGPIMAEEVGSHTLGELDEVLNGVLDELGAPGADDGSPIWPLLGAGLVVAVVLTGAALWVRRSGSRSPRGNREGDEHWAGPAQYRPSFDVRPDEHDTLDERLALAREDVTRLGEQLDREDLPTADPAVAVHVQAALDGYYEASRRVDDFSSDEELRQLVAITDHARWQIECAHARLDGKPLPARRAVCFLDPAHGMSVADVSWAPSGGVPRPVPVCRTCLDRMS